MKRRKAAGGAPAWMTTFADLMAVLVVFFVMLYAFSTIDAEKYERMATSLKRTLNPEAAGQPADPSLIDLEGHSQQPSSIESIERPRPSPREESGEKKRSEVVNEIRRALQDPIQKGLIKVAAGESGVLIRFQEQAMFRTGDVRISEGFRGALTTLARILQGTPGDVRVAGHTDDVPIESSRFRSNWALSAERAVSVVHAFEDGGIRSDRLVVEGHAHTRPVRPNDSADNRARNRRVDVYIFEND
ncbi:chemotaxis protein MotB [Thiohalospira halophila DSM 15071]|uniref:Chemotaxis protein MotB n=1 Tax=Thiohalospira halophila DSM 15071 TaxID=1123397 RepID=A0A1I1WCN9_9GAMM|nr:flagellar motor protein MotB [Thiohalospira halophila]SFD92148.1 chemotaxis protein MotB [Thiohalospira halophila DSM 15071]